MIELLDNYPVYSGQVILVPVFVCLALFEQ